MRPANPQSSSRPRLSRRPGSPLTTTRGGAPEVARRTPAADVSAPTRIKLVMRIRRAQERLDSDPEASHTAEMLDPLVVALAELVRDRWSAERQERIATRARMRVLEGEE